MTDGQKQAHPVVFLFQILPFGIMQGYLTVTLAFMYSKSGISVEQVAALVGLSLLPNIFRFLWAPLVDVTLTVKKWYLITNVITALGIFFMGVLHPSSQNIPLLGIIILLSFFAGTFVSLTSTSFMAYDTSPETKGRAGGYFNIGGTGGVGLGGGAGLWMAQRLPSDWMVGTILALVCLLCSFTLLFVKEPVSTIRVKKVTKNITNVLKDVWVTLKAKAGVLALFLALLPLGTGSAGSLFAAMAKDWHADADVVALITGVLGGIVTSIGCLFGGWICDIINRQLAYVLFGASQAICAIGMAYCPHTQVYYIIWTIAYSIANGFAYAGFTAFVLEVIGKGAASTKYNVYGGISNAPIYFMTVVDGWANTHFGPRGLLNTEALCALVAIVLFFVVKRLLGVKTTIPQGNAVTLEV
jgi:PAT family beta-lactamase induction signal transducer AmpG